MGNYKMCIKCGNEKKGDSINKCKKCGTIFCNSCSSDNHFGVARSFVALRVASIKFFLFLFLESHSLLVLL